MVLVKKFSIVIPVFQNEANLDHTVPALLALQGQLSQYRLELVFVEDGSTDKSYALLLKHQQQHPDQIHVVKLSRNFGQNPAIQAGLRYATGDCVGIISADLQEPCETFVEMIKAWELGAKFVMGERTAREDGRVHQTVANIYWIIVRNFAFKDYPRLGYDFCLLDKVVVRAVNKIDEKNTSVFPLIFWLGFKPVSVPITRAKRVHGQSQWNLLRKVRITTDTLIAFTHVPTRIVTVSGIVSSFLSLLYLIYIFIRWLSLDSVLPGWMTIVGIMLLIGSLTLFSLGIICEYLWRILDETRKRPPFVVEDYRGPESSDTP